MPTKKEQGIDLGKLNPFLQDPNVKTIETTGEDDDVMVSGAMGRKPTGIKLSKEEIDEVIDKFSKKAKIPKAEGLFKVTVDNLIFTAMISDTISSRFIIKKI
jgi:CO dehydrogenase/acetyl-CoA synthase epsilon subunit